MSDQAFRLCERNGPGSDLPPEFSAKLGELNRHAPYLQLHELERLEATPDAVPPGMKDRLDRWTNDARGGQMPEFGANLIY